MPVPEYQPLTESPDGDDELLWPGGNGRYGWLRRVAVVAALALVAAGAGYAVYRNGEHGQHPLATPTRTSRPPTSGTPLSQQFAGSATDAITAGDHSVYVLSSGALYRDQIGRAEAEVTSSAVASGFKLDLTQPGVSYQLVLDSAANRLWIVGLGAVNLSAFALNAHTLAVLGHVRTPGIVQGAAALDGHLYLAEGNGLLDVGRTLAVRRLVGISSVFSLAADPTRHRLIIFEPAAGLVTYQPGLGALSQAEPASVPKGWLNVTAGTVWMAGYGSGGAMIARLDPSTLRPLFTRRVRQVGSPGAQFVGTGSGVLWLGSAEGGPGVLCVSARTGAVLQSWPTLYRVASEHGRAYTDDGNSAPEPLRLAGCPG